MGLNLQYSIGLRGGGNEPEKPNLRLWNMKKSLGIVVDSSPVWRYLFPP